MEVCWRVLFSIVVVALTEGYTLNLTDKGLAWVPPANDTGYTKLYLTRNNISEIATGNFKGYQNLRFLFLDFNRVETLADGAFKELRTLDVLYLDGNPLSTINPPAFDGLSLREGSFQSCHLVWIGPVTFAGGLSQLEFLNLSGNLISYIPKLTFQPLVHLLFLDLSRNRIEVFTSGIFSNLYLLIKIDVSNNSCQEVPRDIVSNLPELQKFDVSSNGLTSRLILEVSSASVHLLAENCTLVAYPDVSFTGDTGLILMSLKYNNFREDCAYDDVILNITKDRVQYIDALTYRTVTNVCIGNEESANVTPHQSGRREGAVTMETPEVDRKDRSDSNYVYTDVSTYRTVIDVAIDNEESANVTPHQSGRREGPVTMETQEANQKDHGRTDSPYIVAVCVLSLFLVVSIGINIRCRYVSSRDQNNPI